MVIPNMQSIPVCQSYENREFPKSTLPENQEWMKYPNHTASKP
jgi:hypothetical protein